MPLNAPPDVNLTGPLDRVHAPDHWHCVDLISDLHLDADHPRTFEAWAHYLEHTPADAVLILGDLFEAWVGDDMRHQPFEARCTQELARTGQRLWLGIMVGNRDFLLGPEMLHACHAHALADPCCLTGLGPVHLLTHGDAWCLTDVSYQAFRQQVRSAAWQSNFLAKPLTQRLEQARQMRDASQMHQRGLPAAQWADVSATEAAQHLAAAHSLSLIHGHTHQPKSAPFALPGAMRHVLSDWDLDAAQPRSQVLRIDRSGVSRLSPEQACEAL